MNIAIVILCRLPDSVWLNFLNNFKLYDIYVFIDDNKIDYKKKYNNIYTNINIVQIDEEFCKKIGFSKSLIATGNVPDKVLSWDKALFYFCLLENKYNHIWLIEDDVFFLSENTIKNIDNKYPNSDLLTQENFRNNNGDLGTWNNWSWIKDYLKLPWFKSMVCACRLSKQMLKLISNFAIEHNRLCYHEALFNTLAFHNNLKIDTPSELKNIIYRADWNHNNLNNNNNLYHPVKNFKMHDEIRKNNGLINSNPHPNIKTNESQFNFNIYNFLPHNFNITSYKYSNPDLSKMNNNQCIEHYIKHGQYEGRNYSIPLNFNYNYYRNNNPDLKKFSNKQLLWHYYSHGKKEGRKICN